MCVWGQPGGLVLSPGGADGDQTRLVALKAISGNTLRANKSSFWIGCGV